MLNIDEDHLDFFGDIDHIEQAFTNYVALLPEDGWCIAWGDDPRARRVCENARCNRLTYGLGENCALRAVDVEYDARGCATYTAVLDGQTLGRFHVGVSSEANMPLRVGESSPLALPVYATFLVVNPYSAHQDEAIAYLEYLASQTSESDYLYYRDMTEPMVNPTIQKELDAQEALLAQLQSEEPTAEVREQMEAAQEAIADYQRALYLVSEEDIAAWQAIAESMAVLEEPLCINSDQIVTLIGRLADGNMSVDAFLKGCDDYLRMVYAENQ